MALSADSKSSSAPPQREEKENITYIQPQEKNTKTTIQNLQNYAATKVHPHNTTSSSSFYLRKYLSIGSDGRLLSLLQVLCRLLVSLYLGLDLSGLGLLHQQLLATDLCLLGVDSLHQHSLVLELVTLGGGVQLAVEVLVDLLGLSILAKQPAQHSQSAHPQDLEGHTRIGLTLALSEAGVSALGLGSHEPLVTGLGVDHIGLADDEPILDELADVLSAVGVSNLVGLVGVHPDLSLSALQHGSCQSLLQFKGHHCYIKEDN
eukprot:CAMPEP_0181319304 /NCGR_PEP_ID=MMETSP1101-20121128/17494_1 /TAXON_ID=46948 /ORGANISM="Rhodomonas abbreviata, Strain Caron Lab Isolate" /LENGTH=261 /DNA_ID=CAMNT_0023426883 /DNA_START=49 /DNA_END=835 /DNA_ORIENTATION=+